MDDSPEISIMESIYERIDADGLDALTEPERFYFAVWWLREEVDNGTFEQYFYNSSGDFVYDALYGLSAVGASQMKGILEAAIQVFPDGIVPTDRARRIEVLKHFTPTQQEQLELLSEQFQDDPDTLAPLLERYVQTHDTQFLGPRTLLERWQARRARGAGTRPTSINREKIEKWLQEDARTATRACPMCEHPCPSWRIECRNCGYPLGRAQR